MSFIEKYIEKAKSTGASDIHLVCGIMPKYRIDGLLEGMGEEILTTEACFEIAKELAGPRYEEFMENGDLDLSGNYMGVRCRIHLFKQQGNPSVAIRLLHETIPELYCLGLPPKVMDFTDLHKGIVLVTGETGSGKSTTLAALLNTINHSSKKHIVTLEDPIEYIFTPDKCVINQREVGSDTPSFSYGLRASLREDPDVILIGEMRDRDTIETAVHAAETGHLVFGTLHCGNVADAIDRMIQVFPEGMQAQIRIQLSMTLVGVLTQKLLPKREGGRVLACELMVVNDAIRNNIRLGKTPQIAQAAASTANIGAVTMDQSILALAKKKLITREVALKYARDPEAMKKNIY